jgi:hypothetical protein
VLEPTLQACAGLHALAHFRPVFTKALDACTRQVYQSRYVDAFITIIQQMPAAVVPGFGREVRDWAVGVGCVGPRLGSGGGLRVGGCAWVCSCTSLRLHVFVYVRAR